MEIVGLSGFARAGKDEVAKTLVEDFGFIQVAFADKLRDMIYALNPIVVGKGTEKDVYTNLQSVIDQYGWGGYKETYFVDEIRRLLQRLGTEAGRETLWDTIWIDAAFAGLPQDAKVVVSDARFFNEFDAIRARGGEIWRIERPGVGPANDHASEMEAIDYPHFARTLHNSKDLAYLKALTWQVYADFQKDRNMDIQVKQNRQGPVGLGQRAGGVSVTSVNVPKRRA